MANKKETKSTIKYFVCLSLAIAAIIVLNLFVIVNAYIPSESMYNTLQKKTWLLPQELNMSIMIHKEEILLFSIQRKFQRMNRSL